MANDRVLPETANRSDWPRLASQIVNKLVNRVRVLESPSTFTLTPGTAPASPVEGQTYYDATAHKMKCWDGTTWQAFW